MVVEYAKLERAIETHLRGGEFSTETEIGRGAYGLVMRARHRTLRKLTKAVKAIPPGRLGLEEAGFLVDLFEDPGNIADHAPRINDFTTVGDISIIEREEIKGKTVEEYVKEKGKLTEPEGLDITLKGLDGLIEFRNRGIIYKDNKPENQVIEELTGKVKFIDHGYISGTKHTLDTLPPECFIDGEDHMGFFDERSIVYGQAIVGLYTLTGELFGLEGITDSMRYGPDGESIPETRSLVMERRTHYDSRLLEDIEDEHLRRIFTKALDPNPEKRYQTLEDFKQDLSDYRDLKFLPTVEPRRKHTIGRRPIIFAGAGLFLGAFLWSPWSKPADPYSHLSFDPRTIPERANAYLGNALPHMYELTEDDIANNSFPHKLGKTGELEKRKARRGVGLEALLLRVRSHHAKQQKETASASYSEVLEKFLPLLEERAESPNLSVKLSAYHVLSLSASSRINDVAFLGTLAEDHLQKVGTTTFLKLYPDSHPKRKYNDRVYSMPLSLAVHAYSRIGLIKIASELYSTLIKLDTVSREHQKDPSFRNAYTIDVETGEWKKALNGTYTTSLAESIMAGITLLQTAQELSEGERKRLGIDGVPFENVKYYVLRNARYLESITHSASPHDITNLRGHANNSAEAYTALTFLKLSRYLEENGESGVDYLLNAYRIADRLFGSMEFSQGRMILSPYYPKESSPRADDIMTVVLAHELSGREHREYHQKKIMAL